MYRTRGKDVHVRLNEREHQALQKLAEGYQVTCAELIRNLIMDEAVRQTVSRNKK